MRSATLYRMAKDEYRFNRYSRAKILNALGYILEEAENADNERVYFTTVNIGHGDRNKGIIIQDISALNGMTDKLGGEFMPENMLRGMQAATQDESGYCMSVLTTNDLYSATIDDLSELVFRIHLINH